MVGVVVVAMLHTEKELTVEGRKSSNTILSI
jgi:hypothetical protein